MLRSEFGDDMLKRLESKGLVGLDFWENGFRHVTNSRRAVKSIEDVKGLKIRTMESPLHLDAWSDGRNPQRRWLSTNCSQHYSKAQLMGKTHTRNIALNNRNLKYKKPYQTQAMYTRHWL
ncbi:hypothetical protein O9993_12070 [Vibrio lentus]|nr:hypothetical protein [Vibrio lentus]